MFYIISMCASSDRVHRRRFLLEVCKVEKVAVLTKFRWVQLFFRTWREWTWWSRPYQIWSVRLRTAWYVCVASSSSILPSPATPPLSEELVYSPVTGHFADVLLTSIPSGLASYLHIRRHRLLWWLFSSACARRIFLKSMGLSDWFRWEMYFVCWCRWWQQMGSSKGLRNLRNHHFYSDEHSSWHLWNLLRTFPVDFS